MILSDIFSSEKIIAIYGLAKNTGKTVALNSLISELTGQGVNIGITSIGRDGEAYDVINNQLPKPRISLTPGMLVATSHVLLRQSGLRHEILEVTPYMIPLGRIIVARIMEAGFLEVAGPGIGEQTRRVAEIMLSHGAEKVLIDGAIDRRSASTPMVSDAIMMATGAALGDGIEAIVRETVEAAQRVCIDVLDDPEILGKCLNKQDSFLLTQGGEIVALTNTFALVERREFINNVYTTHGAISHIVLRGAVCRAFLDSLIDIAGQVDLYVITTDSSKYYIDDRPVSWYEHQGIRLRVFTKTKLRAITVNPVYPPYLHLSSYKLRQMLEKNIPDVAVRDVLHTSYQKQTA
jgi:hypothetical protein